jgi:DNA mismatch endonuclease, patch repair protein
MTGHNSLDKARKLYLRDGRAPLPLRESTSRVMSANRAKNTGPEKSLRRGLSRAGVRGYRLHPRSIPGRPDVIFPSSRVAIFVNGCFWHSCPKCNLPAPRSHSAFWRAKFQRNRERDAAKTAQLKATGWTVLTLWECEIVADSDRAARRVQSLLERARRSLGPRARVDHVRPS